MFMVQPSLDIPSIDGMLDFDKQDLWNRHMGRALMEGSQLIAARINGLLPKDGSEAMTGTLNGTSAAFTGTLTVGTNLTPIGANGSVVDSSVATNVTNVAMAVVIPADDTIPLITEGTQILSVTITPKSVTNKLRCRVSLEIAISAAVNACVAIFQGSTCINAQYSSPTINVGSPMVLEAEYTPGTLTSQTITVRVGPGAAGTARINGTSAGRLLGGASTATLVVEEIKG